MRIPAAAAILWLSCSDGTLNLPSAPHEEPAATNATARSGTTRRRGVRTAPPSRAGTWGGEHIALRIENGRATVELDCAHGTIDEPIAPSADGAFVARGTFTFEHGGPITSTDVETVRPARYEGKIAGDTMRLTIEVDGETVESFTLQRNQSATWSSACDDDWRTSRAPVIEERYWLWGTVTCTDCENEFADESVHVAVTV